MNELTNFKKPELAVSLDVEIPKIKPLKHEMDKVEEFTIKLIGFYEVGLAEAKGQYNIDSIKSERTKIRKIIKTVSDNRKAVIKAFKEPIQDFENTSKRIEKTLTALDDKMKVIVDDSKKETEDPFAGLSVNNQLRILQFTCDDEIYKDIVEYITKKGVIINGE